LGNALQQRAQLDANVCFLFWLTLVLILIATSLQSPPLLPMDRMRLEQTLHRSRSVATHYFKAGEKCLGCGFSSSILLKHKNR
jgi:hypothetical protein